MVKKEKQDPLHKYIILVSFAAVLVIAFMIVKPFITTVLLGGIIAYIFHPLFKWLKKKTKMPSLSAIIVILVILLLVSLPLVMVTGKIVQESYVVYLRTKIAISQDDILNLDCDNATGVVCGSVNYAKGLEAKYNLNLKTYLERGVNQVITTVFDGISNVIVSLPQLLFKLLVMIFVWYYAFVDGDKIMKFLKNVSPLKKSHMDDIYKIFNDIVYATIYGSVVIAIVQGILTGLGLWVFGINSPLFWGVIAIVASFIPFIGAGLVWFPAAMTLLISGLVNSDTGIILRAVGLMVYGLVLISSIDNIIKPKIIGSKAKLHPLIVLLGAFGGLSLFGVAGLMIGPLLLSLFFISMKIYEQEKHL